MRREIERNCFMARRLSRQGRNQDAATSDACLGFRQLREIDWHDTKSTRFQCGLRLWKRVRINQRSTDTKSIGGKRLVGIDVDAFNFTEQTRINPAAIDEDRVICHRHDGRLEVKASHHGNLFHRVTVRPKQGRELLRPLSVCSRR